MVRETEAQGIPAVHVCTVTPISINVGANRVVPAMAIPYPTGNIELEKEDEKLFRRHMLDTAVEALATEITEQTIF
ncbi:glycine/betaine/sarcosine/D-proline family reductase selenoprotein B [Enterocloster sp. 210928-DFI.2.20]|nr:glycine/betaine/sarcosine/D-proline family reductase selenoprotein B [Enterocloster sp. 210928-DFI.2.20]MCB7354221.1 glycine/betaine/sarcosine/D-proline family reductase selenoprotein B [Enterocloster bolteae]